MSKSILIVYTGGTIGMMEDENGSLHPFDLNNLFETVPQLKKIDCEIEITSFPKLMDSADVGPDEWIAIAEKIEENYEKYNGFIVLHGTDTMAYCASALSFMFEGLNKPVIFTGSQLPLGVSRSDAPSNLLGAVELAVLENESGDAQIPEVTIYFEDHLYRANRTIKANSENFDAFTSPNFIPLAIEGLNIKVNKSDIFKSKHTNFKMNKNLERSVSIVKIHPGFNPEVLSFINAKGILLELFGVGTIPNSSALINALKKKIENGTTILAVTQCAKGTIDFDKYANAASLKEVGVVSGKDMTTEAAFTKLMHVLGNNNEIAEINDMLTRSLRGEMSTK